MAIGDTQESTTTIVSIDPPVDGEIQDFDQLTTPEQRAFLRLLDGKRNRHQLPAGLVVRFTSYYRVEMH